MTENTQKLYTHEELENIVEQRLCRERKNRESLAKIRSVLNTLRTKEPFKTLSNAEIAQKLCELADLPLAFTSVMSHIGEKIGDRLAPPVFFIENATKNIYG